MRKLGWYAVSAFVIALILGGLLLLGANLYVQSLAVQHRIRQAVATSLKMPVTLRKTTLTPWDGLRIDGIVARVEPARPDEPAPPDFLVADSFRVRFALWPLLHRQFVIRYVLLDHPTLAWPQDVEGRWHFPPQQKTAKVKGSHGHPKEVASAPVAAPPSSQPAPAVANPAPAVTEASPSPLDEKKKPEIVKTKDNFAVEVDRLRLRHGTLNLLDAKNRPLGQFEEVSIDGHLPDPDHATGKFLFATATLSRLKISITKFSGNFAFVQDTELHLTSGHGELAGGQVLLSYYLKLGEPGSPFEAKCQIQNVSIEQLLAEAGSKMQPLEGTLQGNLAFSGLSDDSDSHEATGHFQLLNAHFKNLPLLQAAGEMLRIQDLSQLQFKKAELNCQLHGNTLDLEPLVLESQDIQVSVHGKYLTDEDRLDLHARLVIDQAISHQLPQFVESNFTPCGEDAPGSRFLEFSVTGPLSKPATNFFNRALSGPMNGFIENLRAPKIRNKKNPKHNNKSPEPSPATPEPSPDAVPVPTAPPANSPA